MQNILRIMADRRFPMVTLPILLALRECYKMQVEKPEHTILDQVVYEFNNAALYSQMYAASAQLHLALSTTLYEGQNSAIQKVVKSASSQLITSTMTALSVEISSNIKSYFEGNYSFAIKPSSLFKPIVKHLSVIALKFWNNGVLPNTVCNMGGEAAESLFKTVYSVVFNNGTFSYPLYEIAVDGFYPIYKVNIQQPWEEYVGQAIISRLPQYFANIDEQIVQGAYNNAALHYIVGGYIKHRVHATLDMLSKVAFMIMGVGENNLNVTSNNTSNTPTSKNDVDSTIPRPLSNAANIPVSKGDGLNENGSETFLDAAVPDFYCPLIDPTLHQVNGNYGVCATESSVNLIPLTCIGDCDKETIE